MPEPLFCLGGYELNRYHTYPHCNGFSVDGREMLVMQMMPDHTSLWMTEIDRLETDPASIVPGRRIAAFDLPQPSKDKPPLTIWPDIALDRNIMTMVVLDSVWVLDMQEDMPRPRLLYVAPKGVKLNELTSLNPQGSKVCFSILNQQDNIYHGMEVEIDTGKIRTLLQTHWHTHHLHYAPNDPDWIGFCHEGATDDIADRLHAYHRTVAPQGKYIFEQSSDDPNQYLYIGHERWCYHETATLAIVYGVSPIGPRGLYKIYPDDDKPAQLISESNRDWHCNISRDGKMCVIDTTGPSDQPGQSWCNMQGESDILLVDPKTSQRRLLAQTRYRFQPWHPHPAFSPDGKWVFYNDYNGNETQPRGRVACVLALSQ